VVGEEPPYHARASGVRRGVIDELMLAVVPVLLGAGERLFAGVKDPGLQLVEVIDSLHATHVRDRIGR
jgi:dihydrofolate reductase